MNRHAIRILLLLPLIASGASLHVREGASGAANGANWTDAFTTITAAETAAARNSGETIYVADGSYAGPVFNTAASGLTYITIKKATEAEHGSATGWDSSYGDGQAIITGGIDFDTDCWVIDGIARNESDWKDTNAYGFKIMAPSPSGKAVDIDCSNITVRYAQVIGNGPDDDVGTADDCLYINTTGETNITVSRCWVGFVGRCPFLFRDVTDSLVEYCFVTENQSTAGEHATGASVDGVDEVLPASIVRLIFRHNIWEDVEGTAVIVAGDADSMEFYGNLIYWTSAYPRSNAGGDQAGNFVSNGSFATWALSNHENSKFYNNTVIVPPSGGIDFGFNIPGGGSVSGNVATNNIFFCDGSFGARLGWDNVTHDYTSYSGASVFSEASGQSGITTAIFVNFAGYDFRLASATAAGVTTPYTTDLLGATRGADGTWDRGAYEYVAQGGGEGAGTAYRNKGRASRSAGVIP